MTRRLALLIANNTYDDVTKYHSLVAPQADVIALAKILRNSEIGNFDEVEELIDAPVSTIKEKIERFYSGKTREDLLLLYFSGHGDTATKRGQFYLIGKETQHELLGSTAISSTFIKEAMNESNSKQQILLLDCCYSGAFIEGTKGGSQNGGDIATQFYGRGRVILTATDATHKAWENDEISNKMSFFTSALVQGLETGEADSDEDGLITIDELYEYIYEKLLYEASEQKPGKWVENQQGLMYIAKSSRSSSSQGNVVAKQILIHQEKINQKVALDVVAGKHSELSLVNNAVSNLLNGILCICPLCAKEFYPGDCRILSSMTGQLLKNAPKGIQRQLALRQPEPLTGPMYMRAQAQRECPHCQYLLPYNIETTLTKSIVIVGDTYSGKSHLFAELMRQIEEDGYYSRVTSLTQYTQERLHENFYRLFEKRQALAATLPAPNLASNEPLIYELVTSEHMSHLSKRYNLVLYEASGEDYANPKRLISFCPYVLSASAIIFLVDPSAMPGINAQLPTPMQITTGRKTTHVLDVIIRLIEQRFGSQAGKHLAQIPIAVTLSKSDLFKYVRGTYKFLLPRPKDEYKNGIDLHDLAAIDAEVREVISNYGNRSLLRVTQGLNAQFFAISVTGSPPDTTGTFTEIASIRCADPFLWCLYKLGLIHAL